MAKSIEQHRQENEPDIVALAEALMPLAWNQEGSPKVREASLRMAETARQQFKLERQATDSIVWELGAADARRKAEDERIARESSPGYHWRGFWRALLRRAPAAPETCSHRIRWDDCPDCSH